MDDPSTFYFALLWIGVLVVLAITPKEVLKVFLVLAWVGMAAASLWPLFQLLLR